MNALKHIAVVFVVLIWIPMAAQEICILDLTTKNAESTKGNLFSLEHILKTAGFSYKITDSVNFAVKSKIVLPTSNIETNTFSQEERDSIAAFVQNGGVLLVTNVKDPLLFAPFGVTATSFNTSRFFIRFNAAKDPFIFKLFDDPLEKEIRLGDTADYATTIGTRAFSLLTGDTLATYETGEVAASHNIYGLGHTYLLGTQYKEVILRPQVKKDYNASRAYSNSFEPGQDVYIFFVAGIIKKHLQYVIWKHTAPCNFRSALVITHDVDATTSMERFDDYASYEQLNNIKSTYLITTHYVHDKLAKNFFDGYENDIKSVLQYGHDIQSHSVSHMPDFDNENRVMMGSPGNNRYNYTPYYNGSESSNVTVFGEAEVSKDLLESVTGTTVECFRPGYLAFHDQLINVLDSLHFPFSSSHSANNVMTHFPFFSHTDLSMNGRETNVLEIPNTISDVFMDEPINEGNYLSKVVTWQNGFEKAYNNYSSTVLLIHPTRYYKLHAEQLLIRSLPQDAVISNIKEFGDYWLNRDKISITQVIYADTLNIYLSETAENISDLFSLVVQNGRDFSSVKIFDKDSLNMELMMNNWETNDIILHKGCERPAYDVFSINDKASVEEVSVFPNPSYGNTANLHFKLMEESEVAIQIFDLSGKLVFSVADKKFNLGLHSINLAALGLSRGLYIVKLTIGPDAYFLKWISAAE